MFDCDAALAKTINEAYVHRDGTRATVLVPDKLGPAGALAAARRVFGSHDIDLLSVESVDGATYLTYER